MMEKPKELNMLDRAIEASALKYPLSYGHPLIDMIREEVRKIKEKEQEDVQDK